MYIQLEKIRPQGTVIVCLQLKNSRAFIYALLISLGEMPTDKPIPDLYPGYEEKQLKSVEYRLGVQRQSRRLQIHA